jgi:cephalosporin hydroxylase
MSIIAAHAERRDGLHEPFTSQENWSEMNYAKLFWGIVFSSLFLVACSDAVPTGTTESKPDSTIAAVSADDGDVSGEGKTKEPQPLNAQEKRDIEIFEHAIGSTHGLSTEDAVKMQTNLRNDPVFQNKFLGVWTVQTPSDAWIIMEIMYEVKPDLIVEAGTFHGGSANLWAIILEQINPEGKIITIDIEDQRERKAKELPISKKRVEFLLGSSTDPKVVAEVHRQAEGKKVLVLLDSLHSKEHVEAELEAYAPIVSVGSYVIVQDTLIGPKRAIDEFLDATDSFVADRKRERYPDTNSIRGYLKRIKP